MGSTTKSTDFEEGECKGGREEGTVKVKAIKLRQTHCRPWTGTPLGLIDVDIGSAGELLEEKGALESQFENLALHAIQAKTRRVVGSLDFVGALTQFFAFLMVGLLDRWRQWRWRRVRRAHGWGTERRCGSKDKTLVDGCDILGWQ